MPLFKKKLLKRKQFKRISEKAQCSKAEAESKAKMAFENGMDIDYFIDNELYLMSRKTLSRYLKRKNPRSLIESMKSRQGVSDYEIYRQMKRARSEFGVTNRAFARKKLLNAPDEELKKVGQVKKSMENTALNKIAEALDVSVEEAQEKVAEIRSKFGYGARAIYMHRLHLMSDEEIAEYKSNIAKRNKKIIEKIQQETGWTESQVKEHMRYCSVEYGISTTVYLCARCFEMDDPQLVKCANMDDPKRLSARYNNGYGKQLDDKRFLYSAIGDLLGRKWCVNFDITLDEFKEFAQGVDEVFCKPMDLNQGQGAFKYDIKGNGVEKAYDYLVKQPKSLVEECLRQHPQMAAFYPGSINTVRLITVIDDDKFDPFLCVARFGVEGVTDNFSTGGIACAVDTKTGVIVSDGCNKYGDVFETHPVSGIKFKGFQIPNWDKALERAEAAMRKLGIANFIGWDLVIQDDDVSIVEGNAVSGLSAPQTTWYTLGVLVRPTYYKYLGTSVYDDMLEKVSFVMRETGCSEKEATARLIMAAECGYDFDFVEKNELYRLSEEQIKGYAKEKAME